MYSKKVRKYLIIILVVGWAFTLIFFYLRSRNSTLIPKAGSSDKSQIYIGNKLYKEKRLLMGTYIEVASEDKRALEIAFSEIERIDKLLSKYNPQSEISQLNQNGLIKASPETFYIIKRSIDFYKSSNGAFDITVATLMDLWGFTDKEYRIPSKEEIAQTLKLVGSDKIILNESDQTIRFKLNGMKIDLGAIAKGYALDCAVKKLKSAGIKSSLINAGGQIYCLGDYLSKPWKIGITSADNKKILTTLEIENKSVSTSGNYRQNFLENNISYGHIIDPRSGYPVKNDITSVTIIAPDGLSADALSTAFFVLGRIEGKKMLALYKNVEVRIN
jgi:thiamine biosynthesis lipoprotein